MTFLQRTVLLLAALCFCAPVSAALKPEDLLLIANQKDPEGVKLAAYYAKARGVPVGQVCAIDVPLAETIDFLTYESLLVPQVRAYLREHQLQDRIKCLVSFQGIPLRIGPRRLTDAEQAELVDLKTQLDEVCQKLAPMVAEAEALTRQAVPSFRPGDQSNSFQSLRARLGKVDAALQQPGDAAQRQRVMTAVVAVQARLGQSVSITPSTRPTTFPADQIKAVLADPLKMREVQEKAYDAPSRALLRAAAAEGGLLALGDLVQSQILYLTPEQNECSVDSELSMLRWTYYPRKAWVNNPLYHSEKPEQALREIYMTARLDGPSPAVVQRMIDDAIATEKVGLKGRVVIDARGLQRSNQPNQTKQNEGYAQFDEHLRTLARLLRTRTQLEVVLDDVEQVIMPGANANEAALYCGWYSVQQYIRSISPLPGSVGYHIASFEMQSLHDPNFRGWVPHLLKEGMTATLGPTWEPYLAAFPRPDEFFPLLLTGKLTLAEVFWATAPLASWQVGLVGDPLYTPYKTNPALEAKDLASWLQPVLMGR